MSGADRRRKRAIRERMDRTGEPYTLAARRHDEARARHTALNEGFDARPGTETPAPTKPAGALDLPFLAPPDQPNA